LDEKQIVAYVEHQERNPEAHGRGDEASMPAAGNRAGGRTSDAGPYPHVHSVAFAIEFMGLLPSEWAKLPIEYDENPLETRDS
jgi:hypothetical protein